MDFLSDRVSWKTLPGLPVGHPSQVQPASCSPRYRAWQDPEGRIYYEDLETGSTDKHLPGVLDSIYTWFMLIDVWIHYDLASVFLGHCLCLIFFNRMIMNDCLSVCFNDSPERGRGLLSRNLQDFSSQSLWRVLSSHCLRSKGTKKRPSGAMLGRVSAGRWCFKKGLVGLVFVTAP